MICRLTLFIVSVTESGSGGQINPLMPGGDKNIWILNFPNSVKIRCSITYVKACIFDKLKNNVLPR